MRSFSNRNLTAPLAATVIALTSTAGLTAPSAADTTGHAAKQAASVKVSADLSRTPTPAHNHVVLSSAPLNADGLNPQEAEFVALVNKERTSRGLNALTVDPMCVQVARAHSAEMCQLNYFDHHSPTAGMVTPMDRYVKTLKDASQQMPEYLLVGENIYYCSILNDQYNVQFGHQSLMNSPGHRANILEPRFCKIGVGTYRDAKGEFWVTETFVRDTEPQSAANN